MWTMIASQFEHENKGKGREILFLTFNFWVYCGKFIRWRKMVVEKRGWKKSEQWAILKNRLCRLHCGSTGYSSDGKHWQPILLLVHISAVYFQSSRAWFKPLDPWIHRRDLEEDPSSRLLICFALAIVSILGVNPWMEDLPLFLSLLLL